MEYVRQCLEAIHTADIDGMQKATIQTADEFYRQKSENIMACTSLALLDGLVMPMLAYKDQTVKRLEFDQRPAPAHEINPVVTPIEKPKKQYKQVIRSVVFPQRLLESDADIDEYVEQIRKNLKNLMNNSDGINLK
jgi:hypothetical protein